MHCRLAACYPFAHLYQYAESAPDACRPSLRFCYIITTVLSIIIIIIVITTIVIISIVIVTIIIIIIVFSLISIFVITMNIVNMVSSAEAQHDKRQEAQERQAQAEEEAGLALLTRQAGMKLTLTQKVHICYLGSPVSYLASH